MKTYIYTADKPNGNVTLRIYRIVKNIPVYLGKRNVSTASMRGFVHEVFNELMDMGEIPKKYYQSSKEYAPSFMGPGYFEGEVKKHVQIFEV